MIPYIAHPTLDLGFYRIEAFSVLVCVAIVVQFQITMRRAPAAGIERSVASSLLFWAIGLGLVGAHFMEAIVYEPGRLMEDPLYLIRIWDGLSSFGGMLGGLLGLIVVMRARQMSGRDILGFIDCLMYALPFTLAVGRLGCGLQHDHPGISSTHWLAVQFPDGPRFDLGLLEFMYLVLICLTFLLVDRRRWPAGFYLGLFFFIYGPVRFAMDSLRISEARYFEWTPGQYLSIVATLFGAGILAWVLRRDTGDPAIGSEPDGSI